jgi:hypothetical protein
MKKKLMTLVVAMSAITYGFAQLDATSKNSWLKLGLEASVPVGDISDASSFAGGIVLDAQWMATPHFGVGVSSGYTNFFGKDEVKDFGVIPLGALLRYYPKAEGFFAGADLGYGFLTNVDGKTGGFYFKPQLGYHNYSWNFYGFYNQVVLGDNYGNVQNAGVGAIYNLRFKK